MPADPTPAAAKNPIADGTAVTGIFRVSPPNFDSSVSPRAARITDPADRNSSVWKKQYATRWNVAPAQLPTPIASTIRPSCAPDSHVSTCLMPGCAHAISDAVTSVVAPTIATPSRAEGV